MTPFNTKQTNSFPLLQYGDWEEGRTHDEDPTACIPYSIEWTVTLNNRVVAKDTDQDPVLAPQSCKLERIWSIVHC